MMSALGAELYLAAKSYPWPAQFLLMVSLTLFPSLPSMQVYTSPQHLQADTICAWSEVLGKFDIARRNDLGALRLRTVASRDQFCAAFPGKGEGGKYANSVVLAFDYTVLMHKLQN